MTLPTDSLALLNQIRTVDKIRLVKKIGTVTAKHLKQVGVVIEISLDTVGI